MVGQRAGCLGHVPRVIGGDAQKMMLAQANRAG